MRPIWLFAAVALMAQSSGSPSTLSHHATDLLIKTRQTFEDGLATAVMVQVLYMKGARRRRDLIVERHAGRAEPAPVHTTLTDCERRRTVLLNHERRTYGALGPSADERRRLLSASRGRANPEPAGPEVIITFEWTHTGEVRQFGQVAAKRVLTTRTTRPSEGASTPAATDEIDGWYLDVQADCDAATYGVGVLIGSTSAIGAEARDRFRFEQHGAPATGYPIEINERTTQGRSTFPLTKIELVEFSEASLDVTLFEVPPAYRPALPLPWGGHDFDRPDTFANRVESYWRLVENWVARVFR